MARFHYGIDCEDDKKAKKLWQFLARLEMPQDGLDLSEARASVIASQALLDELRGYAKANAGDLRVEVWPDHLEYDDAESAGQLEILELAGKAARGASASGPARFKAYAGSRENFQAFLAWLVKGPASGIDILGQWEPQVDAGSWGVEFRCDDVKFDKAANSTWLTRGVVVEKLKR